MQENEARNRNTSIRLARRFWNFGTDGAQILVFCQQLIQTSFYPVVLVTRTGEREIGSVSGRLPDTLGELEYMKPLCAYTLVTAEQLQARVTP